MQTFRNELKVYRGESFTIDKLLQNRDGTPYIISSKLENPYFLISVSNTQYSQSNRYVKNYWLNLSSLPRFDLTQPFDIRNLKNGATSDTPLCNTLEDVVDKASDGFLHGYINGVFVEIKLLDYSVLTDGKNYKYFDGKSLKDYSCRIVKTFLSEDTKLWSAQNYLYSIQLVYGTSTRDYLESAVNDIFPELDISEFTIQELIDLLKKSNFNFPINFDETQPLAVMSSSPILPPTAIKVIDYVQGEITW